MRLAVRPHDRLLDNDRVITDCAVYTHGVRVPETADPPVALREPAETEGDSYVWLDLFDPSPQELDSVMSTYKVNQLVRDDLETRHERPKMEVYEGNLLLVLTPASYVPEQTEVQLYEIKVLTGPGYLITLRHQARAEVLAEPRRRFERTAQQVSKGPFAAVHMIVNDVVDGYGPALDQVEADIEKLEGEVFSESRQYPTERIYRLTRQVIALQQATMPLMEPLDLLARHHFHRVPVELTEDFRDSHEHLVRVTGRINGDRELLDSVLQANLAQITARTNEDMRKISAWVGIIAVPTAVAGIYGMNFKDMPELDWAFGYPYALILMAVLCLGLFLVFKRTGWL